MESAKRGGTQKSATEKCVVLVFESGTCITDILRELAIKQAAGKEIAAAISAIGFADPEQIQEIVKVIDRKQTLAQ